MRELIKKYFEESSQNWELHPSIAQIRFEIGKEHLITIIMKRNNVLVIALILMSVVSSAQATDVVTGLNRPLGLVFNGDELYFSERFGSKVSKIDITSAAPTLIDVVTGLNSPIGMALKGNDLYIAENTANKTSKIDITSATPTPTNVITGLSAPVRIVFNGDDLYIMENSRGKISKIDITSATPKPIDVVTGLSGPGQIAFSGNDLYIAEFNANKISKINLLSTSINPYSSVDLLKIHPNPANEFIQASGFPEILNYEIYNVTGAIISKGTLSVDEKIDTRKLVNGTYYLKFENENTTKFIKK